MGTIPSAPERWFEEVEMKNGCFVSSGVKLLVEQHGETDFRLNKVLTKRRREFVIYIGCDGSRVLHHNSWLAEELSIIRDKKIRLNREFEIWNARKEFFKQIGRENLAMKFKNMGLPQTEHEGYF